MARLFLTVVDPGTGERADVVVTADEQTPVAALSQALESLLRDAAARHGTGVIYVDGQPVDPAATLAASAVREGALVSLGAPDGEAAPEQRGLLEIRTVAGPDLGAVHRLGAGSGWLGSAAGSWARVADRDLPAVAASLQVDVSARCWITPETSGPPGAARMSIEGEPLTGPTEWLPGFQIAVGSSLLELAEYTVPDAALQPSADGTGLDYNRPPRIVPGRRQTRFRLPQPPGAPRPSPLPWLMALLPVAAALALTAITGNKAVLSLALLSPVSILANYFVNRRQGKRSHSTLVREYEEHAARVEDEVRQALQAERSDRRAGSPDPAAISVIASGPRHRLWERRPSDPDHLSIRVGTADLPAEVTVEDPAQDEHRRLVQRTLTGVPVVIALREYGVIGVAGPGDDARAVGRWIIAQAAVLHSPNDLQITVLTDAGGRESWDWVRWLPHARPAGADGPAVLIGIDAESVARRVAGLLELIEQRTTVRASTGDAGLVEPDLLVLLDGSRRLRSLPGVVQLLRGGPAVGVYAVCLDTDERLLPAECRAVVELTDSGMRVVRANEQELAGVRPERVDASWCARIARRLAPIRDVSDAADGSALPSSSRLLDLLGMDPPTAQAIAARWQLDGRTTSMLVGESFDGPFAIDLRRDGPHGLIAGTTGAGKSELLQTIVASLSVANRPDAMTFVLVDYKGGSAFGDCSRLPHTVGMVTDLDAHLVGRALESLTAELRRREHLLADAGAKDIEDYTRIPGRPSLPRLLLVIDEFASMVRDLPDFVTGLVNIAQRGRSLGIHLLLATQRPGGVVSPEIRANTNLRIALRVTDASESHDVLNSPDAARIAKSTPGRAYVRLGHASLVPFQASRVGGRRRGPVRREIPAPQVRPLDWADLGRPIDDAPKAVSGGDSEITDLRVLVEAVRGAAEMAGVPAQHSPWLPALPVSVTLAEIPALATTVVGASANGEGLVPVPYGVEDLPAQQSRRQATIDFTVFGHLLAAGAPRTGRSQLLRTIAGSIANTHSCADVHLYGLDCGNGALLPMTALPHCGAVVTRTEVERAVRLIRRLGEEIRRRQGVLAAGGFASITEQRTAAPREARLPHIVLLLDRWEGFLTSLGDLDSGALTDEILVFLREGASAGVHLIITGDRTVLTGRIATLIEEKIAFRMPDRGDVSLIGLQPRNIPAEIEPGRVFRADSGIEVQVALLVEDTGGAAQAAALTAIGAAAARRDALVPAGSRPFRLGELPQQISYAEAAELRDPQAGPGWVLVGVGGDQLAGVGPDLAAGVPAFAIGGPPKSGRSTALVTMARSALDSGQQVIIMAPRTSPLRDLAGKPGVVATFIGSDVSAADLTAALAEVDSRALIAIDDASALRDADAAPVLREVLRHGEQRGIAIAFAGDPEELGVGFSGWLVDARKARRGALLSPQNRTDGDLVGARLQRTAVGQPIQPGRALLFLGGADPVVIQIPN